MDAQAIDGVAKAMAAFDAGANSVLMRGSGDGSLDAVVSAFVHERSRDGKVLVLVPHAVRETFGGVLRKAHPTLSVGDWDADAIVEVAAPYHAGSRASVRLPETFAWIVVEECHPANAAMIQAIVSHFVDARVLEATRQPAGAAGNLAHDTEISIPDGRAGEQAA